jgi:EAL and modified HD-GYP domain-containing signal transduction protein
MGELLIGRQPIYDRALQVVGYELIHHAEGVPAGEASPGQVLDALMELGMDHLVGPHPAWIGVTGGWLTSDRLLALPPERLVLQIPRDALAEPGLRPSVVALAERGFRFALAPYVPGPDADALLPHVRMAKLNLDGDDPGTVEKALATLRAHGTQVVADHVETPEVFEQCRATGFQRFQGHFLSKPQLVQARRLPAGKAALLKLLAELNDPRTDAQRIEALVARDPGLTTRLLKHINAPYFGLSRTVESMRQAVVLLGLDAVRRWATLIMLVELSDKPQALMGTALVRARMCEDLGTAGGHTAPGMFFTVGLLSVLDALTDVPMHELVVQFPLAEPVRDALLEREGPAGDALSVAVAYERGLWDELTRLPLPPGAVRNAYVEAVTWADAAGATFSAVPA